MANTTLSAALDDLRNGQVTPQPLVTKPILGSDDIGRLAEIKPEVTALERKRIAALRTVGDIVWGAAVYLGAVTVTMIIIVAGAGRALGETWPTNTAGAIVLAVVAAAYGYVAVRYNRSLVKESAEAVLRNVGRWLREIVEVDPHELTDDDLVAIRTALEGWDSWQYNDAIVEQLITSREQVRQQQNHPCGCPRQDGCQA